MGRKRAFQAERTSSAKALKLEISRYMLTEGNQGVRELKMRLEGSVLDCVTVEQIFAQQLYSVL